MVTDSSRRNQIRLIGQEVLYRDLGPVGMIRFLQQFETGHGDYSTERHEWLDQLTLEDVITQMKQHREQAEE